MTLDELIEELIIVRNRRPEHGGALVCFAPVDRFLAAREVGDVEPVTTADGKREVWLS